jgi:amidase
MLNLGEYAALDAVGLAALVRSGELSTIEVTEAAIAAIEALDPKLNALVLRDFELAREAASKVRHEQLLPGVPFLIKDIGVHVAGWPTTMSSRFFSGATPRPDSEIVKRWRAAGVVFLGKTNTPEFAGEFVTEPAFRGVTRNPWDLALTVGGSSGGAAAAVASGMVPVASGSDVGGSIRVPAACCGLFGLKPSRGLNPVGPYHAEGGAGLNCEHVLSRSTRDSAAFLDATAGPESGAPYRVERSVESYLAALGEPLGKLRVACIEEALGGTPVNGEIRARLRDAATLLESLGHEVQPRRFPTEVSEAAAGEGWVALWFMDTAAAIRDRSRELGRPPRPDEIERLSHFIVDRIEHMSALEYMSVRQLAHRVRLAMSAEFADVDLILTPSTATLPPLVGSISANAPDFCYSRWGARSYAFAPFSEVFNVTGQPAASLPLFQSAQGMPIGMQLVGRQDQDHVVLRVAAELEAITGWTSRHPPLWAGSIR